jgi:hypothetical protein
MADQPSQHLFLFSAVQLKGARLTSDFDFAAKRSVRGSASLPGSESPALDGILLRHVG